MEIRQKPRRAARTDGSIWLPDQTLMLLLICDNVLSKHAAKSSFTAVPDPKFCSVKSGDVRDTVVFLLSPQAELSVLKQQQRVLKTARVLLEPDLQLVGLILTERRIQRNSAAVKDQRQSQDENSLLSAALTSRDCSPNSEATTGLP